MRKFAVLVFAGLTSLSLSAQVAVTSQGYATSAGPLVPASQASAPVLFTPTVHLGTSPSTSYDANGVSFAPTIAIGGPSVSSGSEAVVASSTGNQGFNFGAAQFDPAFGVATPDDLAKAAAQVKAKKMAAKRSVTNSDIDRINKQSNLKVGTAEDQSTPNGVISATQSAPAPVAASPAPAPAPTKKK